MLQDCIDSWVTVFKWILFSYTFVFVQLQFLEMVGKNEFEHFVDKMGPPLDNSSLSKYNKVFFHAFINYLQSPSHHLLSSKSRDLFMVIIP